MGRKLKIKTRVINFFSDLVTLKSNYRSYTFLSVLLILFLAPINFLESMPNLSICKRILREYCYSVGITRGVSSLLKGNLELALEYNWLSIPVLVLMIFIIARDLLRRI